METLGIPTLFAQPVKGNDLQGFAFTDEDQFLERVPDGNQETTIFLFKIEFDIGHALDHSFFNALYVDQYLLDTFFYNCRSWSVETKVRTIIATRHGYGFCLMSGQIGNFELDLYDKQEAPKSHRTVTIADKTYHYQIQEKRRTVVATQIIIEPTKGIAVPWRV